MQMGAVMMATGAYNTLALMSQEEGRHMDSPESVKVWETAAGANRCSQAEMSPPS